jgi:hypothetical protein
MVMVVVRKWQKKVEGVASKRSAEVDRHIQTSSQSSAYRSYARVKC